MSYSMSIHRCRKVRIERFSPDNANGLSFVFESEEGNFALHVYDLPTNEIAQMFKALGGPYKVDAMPTDILSLAGKAGMLAAIDRASGRIVVAESERSIADLDVSRQRQSQP